MPHAPKPSRSTETLTLSFGLVTLNVNLYSAVSEQGVRRSQFTADGHPVGMKLYDKLTGEDVDRSEVVKKIMTDSGQLVTMTDDEIEGLLQITPHALTVKSFQPQANFYRGDYTPKSLHYLSVAPIRSGSKKVPNAAGEAAFALIMKAMREKQAIAVCELTSRGTPRPAILLPNGQLWQVYYTAEVRERIPIPDVELNPGMVQQGIMIIESMWEDEPLELTDTRRDLVLSLAEEKAASGDVDSVVEAPQPAAPTGMDDLMAALQASVAKQEEQKQAEAG